MADVEKTVHFIQQQHAQTLEGLHREISNLTQKCSDLQFNLTMQSEAHNTAELQRETIRNLQEKYEQLQLRHSRSEEQRLELESLLSWERLQHNNLVESLQRQLEERDARILKLSKESTLKNEVAKIQAQVKQIYAKNESSIQNSIQEVSTRARSPGGIR